MVCAGLETLVDTSITGILAFPTSCDYYFWAKIMFAFWLIISMTLYFADKKRVFKSDMVSAMGVSSVVTIFVALIGTLLKIIQRDIFIFTMVIGVVFIIFWLLKK